MVGDADELLMNEGTDGLPSCASLTFLDGIGLLNIAFDN